MIDWIAWIEEYGPMISRISWHILGNRSDVEDNVQEVFIEAFRLQDRTVVHDWSALLRRIAVLQALARRRRRRLQVCLDDITLMDTKSLPEEEAIERELETRLRDAVARLPEREGAAFALRYFEGLDLPAIASSLGIRYSAAGAALCRARSKLKGVFESVLEGE